MAFESNLSTVVSRLVPVSADGTPQLCPCEGRSRSLGHRAHPQDDLYGAAGGTADSNYDELGLLGFGAFGATHLVRDKRDDQLYVLKKILCHSVVEANDALAEAMMLSRFDSNHIVQFR